MIARPLETTVSGSIQFAAADVGPGAQRVLFAIDGRRTWGTANRPYRYRRSGLLNTRTLGNGRHVLTLSVFYRRKPTRVARKTIVVRNGGTPRSRDRTPPPPASGNVGAFGPPLGGVTGASVANFNRETYLFSSSWPISQEAGRYQYIVLAGNEHALIPALHALNPNLKVLLYQSILHTNMNDYSYMQTVTGCTAYRADVATHPDWFLHDQNGAVINAPHTTDRFVMDVGNPAYQQQCAANASALAKQYGFDGVFWDVVMGRLDWAASPGITVPQYPTQTSWVAAMTSALNYLTPALHSQGLVSFANVSGTPSVAAWEQWAGAVDGVEEESWTDGGLGTHQQVPYWSQKLTELAWTQANGKFEIVHSYNGSETANTYGLAAMMLTANGHASYSTSNTNYTSNENWFPEYTTAQQLGAPAGSYAVLRNGVYERAFSKGIVLVNPTAGSVSSFSLGGGVYSGSGLSNMRTVSMAPTSGLILLKVG